MSRRILSGMQAEVFKRLANRSDLSASVATFIDDAYRWVCTAYIHPQIEATTTATQAEDADLIVPVATDIWYVEAVKNTDDGFLLDPGDRDEIEDREKRAGRSSKWYWWNSQIVADMLASASTAYKIWYIKSVAEIGTGESPIIDRLFDPVIIMKAAEIGLSTVRDYKEAAFQAQQLERYADQMNLPKKMNKRNNLRAGLRPRSR